MDRTTQSINFFLKFGYFPKYGPQRHPLDFSRIDKPAYANLSQSELLGLGKAKLRESFAALFQAGKEHVVPISGGLDSRLILSALREFTEARNIHTFTYGVAGSYDYDIGCMVAKHAGTRHMTFPLDKLTYHEDELLDFAQRSHCQSILFYFPPLWELQRRYGDSIIWSGYVGDAVAGSHLRRQPSTTIDQAKLRYLQSRRLVKSTKLHTCDDADFLPLIAASSEDPARLTLDEQVLFAEVFRLIEPVVLVPGFEYRTPLINTPWMDFMFSVPDEQRYDEALMIAIARSAFPDLFGLPTKNTRGLVLGASPVLVGLKRQSDRARKLAHRIFPTVNYPCLLYNDFDEAIRQSPDARAVILDNVLALKRRGLANWVDFDGLIRRHMSRLWNHGDALIILASLELNLRARELNETRKREQRDGDD